MVCLNIRFLAVLLEELHFQSNLNLKQDLLI